MARVENYSSHNGALSGAERNCRLHFDQSPGSIWQVVLRTAVCENFLRALCFVEIDKFSGGKLVKGNSAFSTASN